MRNVPAVQWGRAGTMRTFIERGITMPNTKTAKTAVKTFSKRATIKVIDYNASAVRVAARAALADAPISVEKGADVLAVMCNMAKREYYALAGRACGDKRERAAMMKKNAKAIITAKKTLDALLAQGNWSSMAECKLYLRAKGLFDSRIEAGKIVGRSK